MSIPELNIDETLGFPEDDWQNIPEIIPSTLKILQKEIYGLSQLLKHSFHAEAVVRENFNPIEEVHILQRKLQEDQKMVAKAAGEIENVGNEVEDMWNRFSQQQSDTETLNKLVLSSRDNILSTSDKSNLEKHKVPSMWSVEGLQKVVIDIVNQSELRRMLEHREFDLMHLDDEINQLVGFNQLLVKSVTEEQDKFYAKMMRYSQAQDELMAKVRKEQEEMLNKICDTNKSAIETTEIAKMNVQKTENIQKQFEALKVYSTDLFENSNKQQNHLMEKLKANKALVMTYRKEINTQTARITEQERVMELFKGMIAEREKLKEMEHTVMSLKSDFKSCLQETILDFNEANVTMKNEIRIKLESTLKNNCIIDKKMEAMKKTMDEWAQKMRHPAQINEALLFTLEARVKEEESQRIKENQLLKNFTSYFIIIIY